MRPIHLFAAAALLAGLSPASLAQPSASAPQSPAPGPEAGPELQADATPVTTAADMDVLHARIDADNAVLMRRTGADLVRGNASMRAIRPALAFHGVTAYLPNLYLGVPKRYKR